jgi:hypothetical protein
MKSSILNRTMFDIVTIKTSTKAKLNLVYCPTSDIERYESEQSIYDKSHLLADSSLPSCLSVQPSLIMHSNTPHVPTKATVIDMIDYEAEQIFNDDCLSTVQHIVVSADQFENICKSSQRHHESRPWIKVSDLCSNDRK